MTIMPIYKICSKCRRRYLWNPDTGQMECPNCGRMKKAGTEALGVFLKNVMKIKDFKGGQEHVYS